MAKPKSTYSELLRDPKWQEMRLRIMERDGFRCVNCRRKEITLNVHHGCYHRGYKPWEYDPDTLWTLCEDCHSKISDRMEAINECIARIYPTTVIDASGKDSMSIAYLASAFCEQLALSIERARELSK